MEPSISTNDVGEEPTTPDRTAARDRFLAALDDFTRAGRALSEAWGDESGFNADVWRPLPARLTPPLSFDDWIEELDAHYRAASASDHYCEGCERGPGEVVLFTARNISSGATEPTEWCVECIRAMPHDEREEIYGLPQVVEVDGTWYRELAR